MRETVVTACTLPGTPASVAVARAFVRRVLSDAGVAECAETGELCASELCGNAIRHSRSGMPGGTFTVTVTCCATVRIEVHDAGAVGGNAPAVPASPPSPDAEGGRGLWLVEALSARCGFAPGLAWCELEREEGAPAVTGRAAA